MVSTIERAKTKYLKDFLKGAHMGVETFDNYLSKVSSSDLSSELISVQSVYKKHVDILTTKLSEYGAEAPKNAGVFGEIVEFYERFKDKNLHDDKIIAQKALESSEAGYKYGRKYILKVDESDENYRLLKSIVRDNESSYNRLKDFVENKFI